MTRNCKSHLLLGFSSLLSSDYIYDICKEKSTSNSISSLSELLSSISLADSKSSSIIVLIITDRLVVLLTNGKVIRIAATHSLEIRIKSYPNCSKGGIVLFWVFKLVFNHLEFQETSLFLFQKLIQFM